ncbi:MAG: glycosyltransferase family 4 protein, partial [Hyphomicrobiales bacterium]|nr:glycosyltransferase family 4 protein [Hyphomicrobiales bacterium]
RARGHDVRTVSMYRKTDVYDGDPNADFILRSPPGGLAGQARAILGLIRHLIREKPDAVITYQYWGNLFGTIGGRLAGARHLIANQSGQPMTHGLLGIASRLDRLIGSWGAYHHNVVNSSWTFEQFAAYPDSYRRRIRRIDHGVAGPDREYDKTAARAAFGLPRGARLVISSGRLTPEKNQDALVRALGRLPDVHLAIAGAGPSRDVLVAIAEEEGVTDRLHMVGEVPPDRIFEFLACGDIFAFASKFETFGLSVAEAAISGVPVVANDLSVLHEVLKTDDGRPAALFAAGGNAAAFAEKIAALFADVDLAENLSAAGRDLAEKYAPQAMCLEYEKLLATGEPKPSPTRRRPLPSTAN